MHRVLIQPLLILTLTVHWAVVSLMVVSFLFLSVCFVQDIWSAGYNRIPFYISFPLMVQIARIQFGNKCPLTIFENYLKKQKANG